MFNDLSLKTKQKLTKNKERIKKIESQNALYVNEFKLFIF